MTPGSTGAAQSAGGNTVTPRAAFWRALCVWVLTVAAAGAAAAATAAWVLGNAFAPTLASGPPPVRNPIGVAGAAGHVFDVLGGAGAALIAATGLAAIVSLIFRYRRAGTVEREQLKWLV